MDNYWTRIELPNSLVMGVQDVPTLTEERQEAMRGRTLNWVMGILIGVGLTAASAAEAQVALEVHGGVNVPTFKIADAAKLGPSGGAGLGYRLGERVWIMGEADFGFHAGADLTGGGQGPDVKVFHYMAKVGYEVLPQADGPLSLIVNAGAGAMTFSVDGVDTFIYPAINVGAKLIYDLSSQVALVLSPQGDIAFSKEAEVGTTNSWVWPFSAGLRFNF